MDLYTASRMWNPGWCSAPAAIHCLWHRICCGSLAQSLPARLYFARPPSDKLVAGHGVMRTKTLASEHTACVINHLLC